MQNFTLLATKLYIPDTAVDLAERERLTRRLDAGRRGKLVLVSAPAGFGKTSLVTDWLRRLKAEGNAPQTGWLSLDEGDNTPAGFWTYVIAALQGAAGRVGEAALAAAALAAIQSPQPVPVETALASLINDLAGVPGALLLVLDDYHLVTNPEIHRGMDFFIDRQPKNLTLLIATREDPPLSISRLRARGQLTEIRAADLRFSEAEADEFLNRLMGLDLGAEDTRALAGRTEGWITGLRLAGLSLQQEADRHAFVDAFTASHRYLTDYLFDEVLSRQDPEVRSFLLRTSILRRLSPGLCDAVTGGSNGQAALRRLEASNLFLTPLDTQRHWFRYHHLFAQFLRMNLQESEGRLVPELYRRAMEWCAAQGQQREALAYAVEIQDFERAANWVETLAPQVIPSEGAGPVLEWLTMLPDRVVKARPFLCVSAAWALVLTGKIEEAAEYLSAAEAGAGALDARQREALEGYTAAHRAYIQFFQGQFEPSAVLGEQALAHIPREDEAMRVRTASFLGSSYRFSGKFQEALEAFSHTLPLVERAGSIFMADLYYCNLGVLYQHMGRLHQADATFRKALDFSQRMSGRTDTPFSGFPYFATGVFQREWNHLEEAAKLIYQGVGLCRTWQQADALMIGLMELVELQADLRDFDGGRKSLVEARQVLQDFSSEWGMAVVDTYQARLDMARGDAAAVERWVQSCGLSIDDQPSYGRANEHHTLARALVMLGRPADALTLLEKLAALHRKTGSAGELLEVRAWQAAALEALGRRERALEALREAVRIGEPEGYVRSFVLAGERVATLLKAMPPGPYRDQLLAAFEAEGVGLRDQTAAAVPPADELAEPLNEREIAVLRLLAAGLSNREIGAELFLSENTIRWYASQIYLKLGVSGRGAAAARARELGVI